MNTQWERLVCTGIASVVLGASVVTASDFNYNFENLNFGLMNNFQDGWGNTAGGWSSCEVRAGVDVNTSKTAGYTSGDPQVSGGERRLDQDFAYGPCDNAVVWSFHAYSAFSVSQNNFTVVGPAFDSTPGPATDFVRMFGVERNAQSGLLRTWASGATVNHGDAILFDAWYELRMTVDFSVAGARGTLSYRNLSLGESSYTTDSTIQNVNLGLVPNRQGRYIAYWLKIREDSPSYLDNIHFSAPKCDADVAPTCGNGTVDVNDLLVIINHWGNCVSPPVGCLGDIAPAGGNGVVDVNDLLKIINSWGLCPP